ncbi:hypothetical protein AAG570_004170 [Ranatra chinensis]|uniref:CHK kinase-like domain-containing protein n=1 Tax=Ranatra chinensis TaxID=642074 RepID=A0ABD0Y4A2_9HEMI
MYDAGGVERHLTEAAAKGKFGSGAELSRVESRKKRSDVNHHFCSDLKYLEVGLKDANSRYVVVKRQPALKVQRDLQNSPVQFQNEVYFYDEVLPVLNVGGVLDEVFPRFYCGEGSGDPDKDLVVLEDLSEAGFEGRRPGGVYLDLVHCELVLRKLALFHAQSFLARHRDSATFERVASQLQEAYLTEENSAFFESLVVRSMRRGVDPLINQGVNVDRLSAFLERFRDMTGFFVELITPETNTGVVCHGDFCANNMLFKYSEDGRPVDLRFLDLQRAKYSSPVIDLSFFLCLHLDPDTRSSHWDELIDVYYESIAKLVPQGVLPSREDFLGEFSRKVFYGYMFISFFLPLMLDDKPMDIVALSKMPETIRFENMTKAGGQRCTELLTRMVSHLLKKNYI